MVGLYLPLSDTDMEPWYFANRYASHSVRLENIGLHIKYPETTNVETRKGLNLVDPKFI